MTCSTPRLCERRRHPRPDRLALLELTALLEQIEQRRNAGDRDRYDTDADYRWVLHRLWIAASNDAYAYARTTYRTPGAQPWRDIYELRNTLAHERLPDIDEDWVWRITAIKTMAFLSPEASHDLEEAP